MTGTARHLRSLAAGLLTTTFVAGFAAAAYAADACAAGGTLRMARDQETSSLVPWDSPGNGNIFSQENIFDHLVDQLPSSPDVQPALAESWEVSPDALTYTFHIRRGVKFSNGDPLTMDDIKWSLDRMLDPKIDAAWAFLMGDIKNFEVVDENTIKMNMKKVNASVLYTLSLPGGGIASKKAFETLGETAFAQSPIGTGPFAVDKWTLGQDLLLKKNPYYWKSGKPYFDAVDLILVKDDNARMLKIQSGEADISQSVPFAQAKTLDAIDGITVKVEPYVVLDSVWLNNAAKPLDEKAVRQALNYATPKDVINEVVFDNLGIPQNSMISTGLRYWDATVPAYPYDIEKAKQLLATSSVPNGFDLPILVDAKDSLSEQTVEILQSEWAKIGVNVDIQRLDGAVIDDRYWKGDYMARMYPPSAISSDIPDDSEQAAIMLAYGEQWHSFGTNYKSDEATQIVNEAVSTVDSAKREELYHKLQRLGMEDAPQVALIFAPTVTAVSDKIGNFQTLTPGWWRLEDVCFKK
ncbi:MAG: ABC transporter substrate-binding protein [Devosia sp.]|nr:ABC transporter substrate-binding protein [Devosia sp.]